MNDRVLLIVEDNPDDEALVLRSLRRHNVSALVMVAHDGVEALDHLFGPEAHLRPTPSLILLDLKMPRVDGFQVLERIRADPSTHDIPVVVFSSSNEPRDVLRSYELGASSFVRKPVEFDAFSETVRLLGDYWLGVNLTAPETGERPIASAT